MIIESPSNVMMHPDERGGAYIKGLGAALVSAGLDVLAPSLRTAASRNVDVLHVHWEHPLIRGSFTRWVSWAWLVALIARKLRGLSTIYTVHNVHPHQTLSRLERSRRRVFDRCVSGLVLHGDRAHHILDQERPALSGLPRVIVEHGDLRAHGPLQDRALARGRLGLAPDRRVLLAVGAINQYKQLDGLIDSFVAATPHEAWTLVVAGALHDREVQSRQEQGLPPSIRLIDRRLDDDEVVELVSASDAVVTNYRSIHTSGAAYLALSYGRRFFGPRIGLLPEAAERYPDYIELFETPLTSDRLTQLLDRIPCDEVLGPASLMPWASIAEVHLDLYRRTTAQQSR